jgi:hypothetical protein
MKSLIKVLGGMVLCALFIFFGAQLLFTQESNQIRPIRPSKSQDTIPQETYVSEVVLQAPWAIRSLAYDGEESPPGEFGLQTFIFPQDSLREELPDPPLPEGPGSFTVAPNGDIYITDPLNKRIQRFDRNGNFFSVIPIPPLEKSEYLHIQELPELSDSAKVESLRRAGKLPKTLDQNSKELKDLLVEPRTINGYQYVWSLICVDQSNNVYLLWWGDYTKQTLCKYSQQGQLLATYPFFPEVRIGGGLNKLYCDQSDRLFFEYYRKSSDKEILSLREWNSLKIPRMPFTFQIGTVDRVFNPEEQKSTSRKGVREILDFSKIKLRRSKELPGKSLELNTIWNYDSIDEKGNLYHYYPTEEGVTIIKWYKQ